MIRINLLPAEDAARAAGRRHDIALGAFVIALSIFGLIVAHTWQHARLASVEREQRRLTQELVAIQGPYADVTRIEQQFRLLWRQWTDNLFEEQMKRQADAG